MADNSRDLVPAGSPIADGIPERLGPLHIAAQISKWLMTLPALPKLVVTLSGGHNNKTYVFYVPGE